MKKFARFLILALMLSALLCATAFAEDAGTFENVSDGATFTMDAGGEKFDVTYTGATSGKQYLILMVAKDSSGNYTINDSSIQYVNQAAATASGVSFTVYPKDMVDAQIILAGDAEPVALANYVTAAAGGSDVTIENIGSNNTAQCTVSADGETLNVVNDIPCVVLYTTDGGQTYNTLPATQNASGGYDYDLSALPAGATVSVAIKGDSNGDGKLTAADATKVKAAANFKTDLSTVALASADANGDGKITAADATKIKAVANFKTTLAW